MTDLLKKKEQNPHQVKLYFLLAILLLACSTTFFFNAVTYWGPLLRIHALARLAIASISWITVLTLIKYLPAVLSLRSNTDLKKEIARRKLMEEQLLLNENRFKSLVQEGGDLIGILDENGNYLYVSPTTIPIIGIDPEEFIGKNVFDNIHPEDLEMAKATFARVQTEKRVQVETLRYSFREGEYRWIDAVLTNSLNDPAVHGIIVNAHDATERINQQQRFARMFSEAPLCMCILKGPQHVFVDANENYALLTGRRNIKGKTAREVFPELEDQGYFHWLDEVYETGKTFSGHETPLIVDLHGHGNRTTRFINFIYQPFFGQDGKVEGIFYFGTDVTEQVETRKKLEHSEKRFRSLIENSHDILALFDQDGTRKYVSPTFEKILGYHSCEILGKKAFEHVHPDDAGDLATVVNTSLQHPGLSLETCARFRKKDGHYTWLEGHITNMLHVEEVNAFVVNFRNIDERKRAEEERELVLKISSIFSQEDSLKESLDHILQTLCSFTGAKGAEAWITNIDQKEIRLTSYYITHEAPANAAKEKFDLGEGITGKAWQLKDQVYISNIAANEVFQRKEFAQKNGLNTALVTPVIFKEEVTAVIVLYSSITNNTGLKKLGQNVLIQLASDIQRKKTEEELERFFRLSGDLLCVSGMDGYFKKVNPAFTKALGYSEEELLRSSFFDLAHPDDCQRIREEIKNLGEGKETFNFENRYFTKDGKVRNLVWTATPIQENQIYALAKDVTDIKKVEKQAESYSKRIGVILDSITDAFYIIDNTYTVTYWNQQAAKLLGVDRDAILGKNLWKIFPAAKDLKFYTEYQRALTLNTSVRFEVFYPPMDRWFDFSAYPLDEGLGIYFRDITDAKKNYQDLVKTETDVRNFARQLNSVLEEERSRIAREIHDEFGQQLAAIKMSIASFKHYMDDNKKVKAKLDDIALDIDNTMHSLRSFATELRPGILDTMGLIPSLEWLGKEFEKKTGINVYLDLDPNEPDMEKSLATCYFRICQEALTNVLKHAHAKNVLIRVHQTNDELELGIQDDGIGIVEEKIQNPFSMGLLGMKERANLIGGTLSISKRTLGGTIVQLKAKIHAD